MHTHATLQATFEASLRALDLGEFRLGYDESDLAFRPIFAPVSAGYRCHGNDHFALYAVALAYRWARVASTFVVATDASINAGLHAPAVLCGYTAAYHTLHAYLALNGSVIVDRAYIFDGDSSVKASRAAVAARLIESGTWNYSRAGTSHTSRWAELKEVWRSGAVARPRAFDDVFEYLFRDDWKVPPTLDWLKAELQGQRASRPPRRFALEEKLDELLGAIAAVRHDAHYRGFGADEMAYNALRSREEPPYALDLRAIAMLRFAHDFLCEVASTLCQLLTHVQSPKSKSAVLMLAHAEPFSFVDAKKIASERLARVMAELTSRLRA